MSQKITVKSSDNKSSGHGGYFCPHRTPEDIVGRLITLIEALGLTVKQEEALKGLVGRAIYDTFSREYGTEFVPPELETALYQLYVADRRRERPSDVPVSTLDGEIEIIFTPRA